MAHLNKDNDEASAWAVYWKSRAMPILETTRTELQHLVRRAERVRTAEVAEVVLKDPLLTLQALRFIGGRTRTSLSAEVVSIENIVMLIGVAPFLERFSALPTVESIFLPKYPAAYQAFLGEVFLSRFAVRLARVYAHWRNEAHPEEITAAAILSRCPSLLELVGSKLDVQMPPSAGELDFFLENIGLPEQVWKLVKNSDEAPPRVTMQRAVVQLVKAFNLGWWQPEVQQAVDLIAGILNMEPDEVWQALSRTALSLARDPARFSQLDQPARWLPMLPGAWPIPPEDVPSAASPEKIAPDILSQRMQALHLAGKSGAAAKEIMALTVRALAEGLSMRRIVFNLMTPDKLELRARYVLGFPQEHPLHKLVIQLDAPHLFAKLLEKPQSVWFNSTTAKQFAPLLPTGFQQHYPATQFCAMSIFVGEKPLGLILGDCQDMPLTEHHYQHFKQICLLTTRALTHSATR